MYLSSLGDRIQENALSWGGETCTVFQQLYGLCFVFQYFFSSEALLLKCFFNKYIYLCSIDWKQAAILINASTFWFSGSYVVSLSGLNLRLWTIDWKHLNFQSTMGRLTYILPFSSEADASEFRQEGGLEYENVSSRIELFHMESVYPNTLTLQISIYHEFGMSKHDAWCHVMCKIQVVGWLVGRYVYEY
jgi:hypothetical protein